MKFTRNLAAGILCGAALLIPLPAQAVGNPVVAGHRGAAFVPGVPEQSTTAFKYAMDNGAKILEMDLRWTADQRMVLLHDNTLDRTTDCTGPVEKITYTNLRKCADTTIVPNFYQILQLARDRAAVQVNVHLQTPPGFETTTTQAHEAVERVNDYSMGARTVWSCFRAREINLVKAQPAAVGARYSLITGVEGSVTAAVAKQVGTVYMPDYRTMTAAKVAELHKAGVQVWAWPADTEDSYRAIRAMSADVAVFDDPKKAAGWAARS